MSQCKRAFVVALCGRSGAGKSTLIQTIIKRHSDVTFLAIDEYESVSIYPDTAGWLARGANPDEFQTPQFIADLQLLATGHAITLPNGQSRQPAPLIIVEEPFGRERQAIAPLLDVVAYVQIPADLALARKLLRRNTFFPWEQDSERHLKHLHRFLEWYRGEGYIFGETIDTRVRPSCDLMLDGTRTAEELADALFQWLATSLTHAPATAAPLHR